jgi:hypothetical protein
MHEIGFKLYAYASTRYQSCTVHMAYTRMSERKLFQIEREKKNFISKFERPYTRS